MIGRKRKGSGSTARRAPSPRRSTPDNAPAQAISIPLFPEKGRGDFISSASPRPQVPTKPKEISGARETVRVSNAGDAPLTIENVTTSCSCTTTRLGKASLEPGESTTLEVLYNTYKFPGKFEKYVTLVPSSGSGSKTVITLRGTVDPLPMAVLKVDPRKVTAGDMKVGVPVRLNLTVVNTGDADLVIRQIAAKKAGETPYDAGREGPLRMAPGETRNLPIHVTARSEGDFLDCVLIYAGARNVTENAYKVVVTGEARR